jgi:hypothetical protein
MTAILYWIGKLALIWAWLGTFVVVGLVPRVNWYVNSLVLFVSFGALFFVFALLRRAISRHLAARASKYQLEPIRIHLWKKDGRSILF